MAAWPATNKNEVEWAVAPSGDPAGALGQLCMMRKRMLRKDAAGAGPGDRFVA